MRYPREHKDITRTRILEKAGERFKKDGIAASGIATLMADAGLTNGAFPAHFASKEDLVTSTVAALLEAERSRLPWSSDDEGAPERKVREYLSPAHRDDPSHGCPTAALVEEIARSATATREAYTAGVLEGIDGLISELGVSHDEQGRAKALAIFSVMVGTMQIARAVSDPGLSDAILEHGIKNTLSLIG